MEGRICLLALACIFFLTGCQQADSRNQPTASSEVLSAPTTEEELSTTDSMNEPDPANDNKGNADVLFVKAVLDDDGTWAFHVTVSHPDTGWEDYTDGWDLVTEDGKVIKKSDSDIFTRLLLHPHENEQPFTRSQSGLNISNDALTLTVRAHDIVDGFGGAEVRVDLSQSSGPNFEVIRTD